MPNFVAGLATELATIGDPAPYCSTHLAQRLVRWRSRWLCPVCQGWDDPGVPAGAHALPPPSAGKRS